MGPCQMCKQKDKGSEIIIPDDISTIRRSGKDTQSKVSKIQNGSFAQNLSELQLDSQSQKKKEYQTTGGDKQTLQANYQEDTLRRGTNTYFCSIENDVESNKNKLFNNAIIDINENKSDFELLLELEKQSHDHFKKDEIIQEVSNTNKEKILDFLDSAYQSQKEQNTKTKEDDNGQEEHEGQGDTNNSITNILKDLDL